MILFQYYLHILNLVYQTDTRTSVKVCDLKITFLDLCNNSIHHCHRPLGLSALLIRSVFLLLFTATGGQIWGRVTAITSPLLRPTAAAHCVTAHRVITTITGHLQALGTDRLPVTRITATAGVWIRVMSLSAWPSYLGDDADLKAPRTESGKPQEGGDLKAASHVISKCTSQYKT